ncbi:cytochrome d ubiquinol oxidase subunit II [Malaciobacter molluscorum LMG 25693]|uniref:Cyanide-insensitive cytochrome oxidase CioAB, subunit II n=1 Tax=Malaciobacter molluscorum LMG 25693 TaxID=870501 RepID=A0A2G1DET0_9BACT|nr:cytochrome d ubiquinol oxidase subunit II [Malaciobacter molluscorum]AXX93068.1 cyanide-insensitive cytochrome oxidase CioAB, subunit II [Malaciobacter molluscorum LMG 25693]PHO16964.1 cytochrome d ubiquinol oxidase subunit II [Malaciobacter molluscorum LMG 25693]RXJ95539.1 cytochrome d ubiquinol oxidase subunit II [Malaciobacter molluscorum]
MFENLNYLQLQHYWWIIISLLGGLFAFMMFVQGGQMILGKISKNDEVLKTMLINSLGRKWELGFTTLVLFGGALFAAFPLFYSTSFGGAYWVWMSILFCFIIQAVSYEYRKKPNNFLGQKVYEIFLYINGSLGVFLLGVAIATFFSGSQFYINEHNFTTWENSLRGLESLGDPFNVLLGISLVFLVRILGAMYFINNIDNEIIRQRSISSIKIDMIIFLVFFLNFLYFLFTKSGFSYNENGYVSLEKYKYINNFLQMPVVGIIFLLGIVLVIFSVFNTIERKKTSCIKIAGIGTVLTVMALFINVGFNNTSYYPSLTHLQSSLTIQNSSGSQYTLTVMSYVSLLVPFVLAYITYAWYQMDKVKITEEEITAEDAHNY